MNNYLINNFDDLKNVSSNYNINLNDVQLNSFKKYYEILLDWNKKINLISRKESNILEKHFLDSILFLPEIEDIARRSISASMNVFDIGSGGGFPAIPLAIMKPEWKFVLCESITKKANFLNHLVKELNLTNQCEIVNARVGAFHGMPLHPNNKYDLVTARAISKLDELTKYSLPLLKKGGYLLTYKGKNVEEEIKTTEKKYNLPIEIFTKEVNGIERKLVVVKRDNS